MLRLIKQARAAVSLLNPAEVHNRATRPISIGLVANSGQGYADMEDFLVPGSLPRNVRMPLLEMVFRAGDPGAPQKVDFVLYEEGLPCPDGAYILYREHPETTIAEILHDHDDLSLALARHFPPFRKPVVDRIINAVARENAFFAIATALPNVVPNLIEIPWAFGEFASDTAFLTANQVRMAFLIAAACGKDSGLAHQKAEVLAIGASAFGWRALARELVGHIPLGGGLIPKGAIAYAGTYVVGKGLERLHNSSARLTRQEHRELYRQGYQQGRSIAESAQRR
jgi:uncharacterized protein (DUF697 family)